MHFKISTATSEGIFINEIYCFLALIILLGHDVLEIINDSACYTILEVAKKS